MNTTGREAGTRLRLVGWLIAPTRRRAVRAASAAGELRRIASVDILAPEHQLALAWGSLWLLLAGGLAFLALDVAAFRAHPGAVLPGNGAWWMVPALVVNNLLLYVVMLGAHELVHAAAILALGGWPRFGIKWPLAAYCTAPGQVFTRPGYIVMALAPLVAISAAGAAATWRWPGFGAYLVFALAGNVSGAIGDLFTVRGIWLLPRGALIADTATGYDAYTQQPPS